MSTTTNSPRILYVSPVRPGETAFGGGLRSSNVLRALQQIGKVEVLVLRERAEDNGFVSEDPKLTSVTRFLEVKQRLNESVIDRIRWTFDPRSSYPNGCVVEPGAFGNIRRNLKEFDLIWFFQLRSPDVFPNAAWPRSVIDIDNIPSMYERAKLCGWESSLVRLSNLRRLLVWKRREKLLGERFDVLAVCSKEDESYLRRIGIKSSIHVIPNGFEPPETEPVRCPITAPRVGFIGLFEYSPNREGMKWFVDNCWPRIRREIPKVRLRLVGQDSDGPLRPLGPDIDGLGWLANPADEIKTWSVMVVPLHVGAGTRIKIAYGFSQKCPIVSTELGAYGYGAKDGHQMYIANTPELFSDACIRAICDQDKAAQIAERAWHEFMEKWTWDAIRPRILAAAEDCLRQRTLDSE